MSKYLKNIIPFICFCIANCRIVIGQEHHLLLLHMPECLGKASVFLYFPNNIRGHCRNCSQLKAIKYFMLQRKKLTSKKNNGFFHSLTFGMFLEVFKRQNNDIYCVGIV